MGKARELKKRADSMLEEVFRSLFEEINTEKIRRDVAALKESEPDFQSRDHARLLVRRTALRCAAAGAVSGLPGGMIAIGTLGAELAFLVFQQFRLILGIATVYGHEPSQRERFAEAMSCLAYASGVGIGKQGLATMLESATMEGGVIAEKLGANFFRERLAKAIPFVGIVSGGALNYVSVRAVGRAAIKFYESQIDTVIADEIWAEGDREHA
ncbi:MAG TPA: EcsC family protein [Thermoanaerobaculia bacterium]